MKGNIYSGPDLLKILILLEDIQSSQLDTEEQKTEIYSNAYIPPETIKSNKNLTSRVDSWVFGIILFNILFGHSPISYYTQIKEWWEYYYNQKFTKDVYDIQFMNSKNHFYYNPFSNISEIMEDKDYFLKALKLKSFSAVVKKTHLNLATENNNTINGIGIILI
jgi:serine/threonine protein kinase